MIDGTWKLTLHTPIGVREVRLDVQTQDGALTGTQTGREGTTEVYEGTVAGDAVAWKIDTSGPTGPLTLAFSGTVEGDSIAGEVSFGDFVNGPFEGTRAKPQP